MREAVQKNAGPSKNGSVKLNHLIMHQGSPLLPIFRERSGNVARKIVSEEFNERETSIEEVREAVNEMKYGKAPGLHEFSVEYLKNDGMAVLEWLVRLLNVNFDIDKKKRFKKIKKSQRSSIARTYRLP